MAYVTRKEHLNYMFLNTGTSAVPAWTRLAKVVGWQQAMNPEIETKKYIADEMPTDVLKTYKPSTPQAQEAMLGEPIYDYLFEMTRTLATGQDAVKQMMRVYQEMDTTDTANLAYVVNVLLSFDNDDMTAEVINYVMTETGSRTHGTATVAVVVNPDGTKTYTPTFVAD